MNCEHSKQVLIVDDDPVVRLLVSDFLASHGYAVVCAEGGEECLRYLAAAPVLPDLVLLDLQMADMLGIDVLKLIRADQKTAPLHIVMLSANGDTAELAAKEGVILQGHIQKPFEMQAILEVVLRATGEK